MFWIMKVLEAFTESIGHMEKCIYVGTLLFIFFSESSLRLWMARAGQLSIQIMNLELWHEASQASSFM